MAPGTYDLEFYVWTDDTTIVELLGPGNETVAIFPANDGTAVHCANGNIACQQSAGGRFTASGLSGGSYALNLYAFQVGSDVFGSLWGGVFTPGEELFPGNVGEIPETTSVLLLGSGLVGLGLFRKWHKQS